MTRLHIIIREPTQGIVVWEGEYATEGAALADYREEIGPDFECADFESLEIEVVETAR